MKSFYGALGCVFCQESVDKGTSIEKAKLGELDFVLYSAGLASTAQKTPSLQLSLRVMDIGSIIQRVQAVPGSLVIMEPSEMPEGLRSIVLDPDGNSVDLLQVRAL